MKKAKNLEILYRFLKQENISLEKLALLLESSKENNSRRNNE